MTRTSLFGLLAALVLPSLTSAQYVRQPERYLLINPPVQQPPPVHVVHVVPPPRQVVVVRNPPPVQRVRVRVETTPTETRATNESGWFIGAAAGALLRFDNEHREATPSYRLDAGVSLGQAEFGLRFDLAPAFQTGDERAALYTAGAGFGYRFLEGSRVRPVIGLGLESVFFNPVGAETSRAFAVNARVGLDLDVPTNFGALSVGLDVTGHQPIAGADQAENTLLGIAAHLALRFE